MDGGYVNSGEFFPQHRHTFLVFWDSDCPHCVESLAECEEFFLSLEGDDIAMLGIHVDSGDMTEAQRLVVTNGITFPQLWDTGGETRTAYGVAFATFSVFLVDGGGVIEGRRLDPQGDMGDVLDEMLAAAPVPIGLPSEVDTASVAIEEPAAGRAWNSFVFRSDLRVRFLSVDSRGELAAGPYGEVVQPGNSLLYRFQLEMSRKLNRHVRVGGLLRISNEDDKVLELGPQYFGVPWGSAFAELSGGGASLRLGYYAIWTTPLTFMRWDWNDNPRIGGTAGCGCGAAAGVLLLESLEILGPELVFEGGIATYSGFGLETRLFYGIPRRSVRTTFKEYRATGENKARYSVEIAGLETSWRRFDTRTRSFWRVGARVGASWEDPRSVDFESLGYAVPDTWYKSAILTADAAIPLVRYVDLEGEWILYNQSMTEGTKAIDPELDDPVKTEAYGGVGGVVLNWSPHLNVRGEYIRLDPGFFAPFAALSYKPNREGGRFSGLFLFAEDVVGFSLFYKWLQQIEPVEPSTEKKKDTVFGTSVDLEFPIGLGGSVGWLRSNGPIDIKSYDELRKALVVSARWRPYKTGLLELQYQHVDVDVTGAGWEEEALTNLYNVFFSATF